MPRSNHDPTPTGSAFGAKRATGLPGCQVQPRFDMMLLVKTIIADGTVADTA